MWEKEVGRPLSVSRWEALIENHSPCKVVMSVDDNHLKDKSEVSPLKMPIILQR